MKSFKDFVTEINAIGGAGVFGQNLGVGNLVGNSDSYATGDSRVPFLVGTFKRAGLDKVKKRAKLKNAFKRKSKRKRVGKRVSRNIK